MAIFMGDDISAGEFSRRAKAAAQFIEESQIQIDVLIAGTIERPRGGLTGAAAGGRGIVVGGEGGGTEADTLRRANI
jgi:hypothetical protein